MITEFGKILRKIRIDCGEVLKDMADKLNSTSLSMSSAYLSAIEVGKRAIPDALISSLQTAYDLSDDIVEQLRFAADQSAKSIKLNLDGKSGAKRNAALVFARNFESMDKNTAENILKLFGKGGGAN
jgi:transcriptional regulator with XRE-family HTH domain